MNSRKRKKALTKWMNWLNDGVDKFDYCVNCNKKLDLKRNKYAIRYQSCDVYCYENRLKHVPVLVRKEGK